VGKPLRAYQVRVYLENEKSCPRKRMLAGFAVATNGGVLFHKCQLAVKNRPDKKF
jgi:hypothetical protein